MHGRGAALPRSHAAVLLILLAAFVLRVYDLGAVRHTHDDGVPHGLGIRIVELISRGRWSELPVLSFATGIDVSNPPGASYGWAILAAVERSPYVAVFVSGALSTLAVALVFDLGRRLFTRQAGMWAALLAAASPWAAWMARATWIQGQLEFHTIVIAWLVWIGLAQRRPRRVLAGLVYTALAMQTYLMAMLLIAPVTLAVGLAFAAQRGMGRALRAPLLAGLAACVASAGLYGATLALREPRTFSDLRAGMSKRIEAPESIPNPFGLYLDAVGLRNTVQTTSGGSFDALTADVASAGDAARRGLAEARATLVELLLAAGALMATWRVLRGRHFSSALALCWFGAPVVAGMLITIFFPNLAIGRQYVLVTSPGGYLLAALPLAALSRVRSALRPAGTAAWIGLAAFLVAAPTASLIAHTQYVNAQPIYEGLMENLPLRAQMALGQFWRDECREVVNPQLQAWSASIYGSALAVRAGASQVIGSSDVWEIQPAGGTCVSRLPGDPAPPNAERIPLAVGHGEVIYTYRSLPTTAEAWHIGQAQGLTFPLRTNIGWSLLGMRGPESAAAGSAITLTHAWRIDALPAEPHDGWYYPLFIALRGPDGSQRMLAQQQPSVAGFLWRPGDLVLGDVVLSVPAAPPGDYTLVVTLFDPVARKNAVFFAQDRPAEPVLEVKLPLRITTP